MYWVVKMESIIKVDKLTFRYKDKFIFDKFSLEIKEGEWISISGPNGSGKSTLIKILSGLINVESDIYICGLRLNKDNIYNIRKNIGIIFDNPENLFLCETVEDDIAFTLENLCVNPNKMRYSIGLLAKELNITHLLKKSPNELSGGEKVKVALACALIHEPKILILDESLSIIDEKEKIRILKILDKMHKEGMTIINVIHDLRESYYADRLIILNNGEVMLDGKPLKVMEYDRILNKLGIELPFEIELSIKLKLYGIFDRLIPDVEEMVNILWQ